MQWRRQSVGPSSATGAPNRAISPSPGELVRRCPDNRWTIAADLLNSSCMISLQPLGIQRRRPASSNRRTSANSTVTCLLLADGGDRRGRAHRRRPAEIARAARQYASAMRVHLPDRPAVRRRLTRQPPKSPFLGLIMRSTHQIWAAFAALMTPKSQLSATWPIHRARAAAGGNPGRGPACAPTKACSK